MPQVIQSPAEAWDKFYSVYMFDEIKYHKLCKEYPNENRKTLKMQCFIYDEDGKRVHLGDEKHIFRIQDLHIIQELLAEYCKELYKEINFFEKNCSASIKKEYYTLFYECYDKGTYTYGIPKKQDFRPKPQLTLFDLEPTPTNQYRILNPWSSFQVELNNTWQLPIKTRLLLHLEVLRLCKKGETLEAAAKSVLERSTV